MKFSYDIRQNKFDFIHRAIILLIYWFTDSLRILVDFLWPYFTSPREVWNMAHIFTSVFRFEFVHSKIARQKHNQNVLNPNP